MKSRVETVKSKERRGSTGSIEEYTKRKRQLVGERERGEGEKKDLFKRSNIMIRSPPEKGSRGEDMSELLKEWREEMKKEMREGMRGIREEVRKTGEEQREELRREVERMRKELGIREEKWKKEREEFKERIEVMERKLEEIKINEGEERG